MLTLSSPLKSTSLAVIYIISTIIVLRLRNQSIKIMDLVYREQILCSDYRVKCCDRKSKSDWGFKLFSIKRMPSKYGINHYTLKYCTTCYTMAKYNFVISYRNIKMKGKNRNFKKQSKNRQKRSPLWHNKCLKQNKVKKNNMKLSNH